ncbi:MAG: VacJ family lipoprotein [Roseivivax sp.]|nr:VacJ family lipoprotein [Roseivivax sp.]
MKAAKIGKFLPVFAVLALSACATPQAGQGTGGIYDPNEAANRRHHEFNKKLDRAVVRPVARTYVAVVPEGMRYNVSSFADFLGTPSSIVNQILQGDLSGAGRNTLRMAVNATVGFGGIADPASELGLTADPSDFGETLYVWGAPEGAYKESLVTGPSTQRDSVGSIVDLFLDPVGYLVPAPQKYYGTAIRLTAKVGDRGQFSDTVDGILYESADSYAQARLMYLQNRRFELGDTAAAAVEEADPFALDTEGF